MKTITIVVINPGDEQHRGSRVGIIDPETVERDALIDPYFGINTTSFLKFLSLTPKQAADLLPSGCCMRVDGNLSLEMINSMEGWENVSWLRLGLDLSTEDYKKLAEFTSMPVARFTYERKQEGRLKITHNFQPNVV